MSDRVAVNGYASLTYVGIVPSRLERLGLSRRDDEHAARHEVAVRKDALELVRVVLGRLWVQHGLGKSDA